jgi:hypothetical protein
MTPLIIFIWKIAVSPLVKEGMVQAAQAEMTDHRGVEVKTRVDLAEGLPVQSRGGAARMGRGAAQAQREVQVHSTVLCAAEAVGRVADRQVWDAMMVTQEQAVMEALAAMGVKG